MHVYAHVYKLLCICKEKAAAEGEEAVKRPRWHNMCIHMYKALVCMYKFEHQICRGKNVKICK
jgi:hypothetical protein